MQKLYEISTFGDILRELESAISESEMPKRIERKLDEFEGVECEITYRSYIQTDGTDDEPEKDDNDQVDIIGQYTGVCNGEKIILMIVEMSKYSSFAKGGHCWKTGMYFNGSRTLRFYRLDED